MPVKGLADREGDIDIDRLVLHGKKLKAVVSDAIADATIDRSIATASVFTLTLRDPERDLIRSKLFNSRTTATIDGLVFEMAGYRKDGDTLTLSFEPRLIGQLRRKTGPRVFAAAKFTRPAAARGLVKEIPGARFAGADGEDKLLEALVVKKNGTYWKALNDWAAARQWRCFEVENEIRFGPDSWLLARHTPIEISEDDDGIDYINPEYDRGKLASNASVICRARRWQADPGTPVKVKGLGDLADDGLWLVESINRSMFSSLATVQLVRKTPDLPEPKPETSNLADGAGGSPGGLVPGGLKGGWAWPCPGGVGGGFGEDRGDHIHQGIDILAGTGTTVVAARSGHVSYAGVASGYGNVVYIEHDAGYQTRYAHLSRFACSVGDSVAVGQKIGEVGETGNATGPHLHFEVRIGGTAIDPLKVLP